MGVAALAVLAFILAGYFGMRSRQPKVGPAGETAGSDSARGIACNSSLPQYDE